jgi:hypothetical protein
MPDPIDTGDIVVTAPRLSYGILFPFTTWFNNIYVSLPANQRYGPFGNHGSGVAIYYDGVWPPLKPTLVENALELLTQAQDEVWSAITALPDNAQIRISATETISGAVLKQRLAAWHTMRVTEKFYRPGYGGANHISDVEFSSQTVAGWGIFGSGGMKLLIIHELAHNSIAGDAIRSRNWNEHLAAGGSRATFIRGNPWFDDQEARTNRLAMNLAAAIGIDVAPTGYYGPYPPGGVHSGNDM